MYDEDARALVMEVQHTVLPNHWSSVFIEGWIISKWFNIIKQEMLSLSHFKYYLSTITPPCRQLSNKSTPIKSLHHLVINLTWHWKGARATMSSMCSSTSRWAAGWLAGRRERWWWKCDIRCFPNMDTLCLSGVGLYMLDCKYYNLSINWAINQ